jgi:hypothetical protein
MYACDSCVHQKCSNYALTNLLFGLCMCIWIIHPLVIHPSPHLGALAHLLTPKVLWAREHTPKKIYIVSIFGLAFESFKEFEGASQIFTKNGVFIIFLTIFICMCVRDHRHMMATHIFLHVIIQYDLIIWPTTFFICAFVFFPSSHVNYDGVIGSPSSSIRVPSSSSIRVFIFYSTNASWFALYF